MSDRYDLKVDTGSDSIYIFNIVDASNVPLDTTGYEARMQIRPYRCANVVFDELTTANGRLKFVDVGKLQMYMTSEATDTYTFDTALYDIEVISKEGKVTRIVEGRVVANHGVTR